MSLAALPEELCAYMADDEDNLRSIIALLEGRGGGLESSESGVGRLLHPEDYSESEDYEDEDDYEDEESEGDTVRSSP